MESFWYVFTVALGVAAQQPAPPPHEPKPADRVATDRAAPVERAKTPVVTTSGLAAKPVAKQTAAAK